MYTFLVVYTKKYVFLFHFDSIYINRWEGGEIRRIFKRSPFALQKGSF